MQRRTLAIVLLVAFVPVSSLLGLLKPMTGEFHDAPDLDLFVQVWSASFWGDLVFAAGTVGAAWLVHRLVVRGAAAGTPSGTGTWLAASALASFLLHWAVYAFSWSFTGPNDDGPFFRWAFQMSDGKTNAWSFTLEWGWVGLLFAAAAGPAVAWWMARRKGVPAAPAPRTAS